MQQGQLQNQQDGGYGQQLQNQPDGGYGQQLQNQQDDGASNNRPADPSEFGLIPVEGLKRPEKKNYYS